MPISLPGPARPSESAAGKWSSLFAKDEEDFGYAKAFCNRFPLARWWNGIYLSCQTSTKSCAVLSQVQEGKERVIAYAC